MAKQLITIGAPGAGGGDPAHVAFKKFNDNATELYNAAIPDTEEKKTQARANLGLGTAATKNVGTAESDVMGVGVFGLGGWQDLRFVGPISPNYVANKGVFSGFIGGDQVGLNFLSGSLLAIGQAPDVGGYTGINTIIMSNGQMFVQSMSSDGLRWNSFEVKSTKNTTIDANGFIKSASPVVNLFSDKIDINDEGQLQDITFEKLGVGDYLVKGSLGFAQTGWYIEMPKDANGNVLVAVVYEQLENNDISVKTYAKKFDDETGDIVANLTKPRDIPAGRWIDLRLQELPQPEIQIPESIAPPDFQPTNLEALNNGSE